MITLTIMITSLGPLIPRAIASGIVGPILDGTGSSCSTSSSNSISTQFTDCGPRNGLCGTHPGGFCPPGELVILQILLNNTGTVTNVIGNQGLDHWRKRASVTNGLGGRMEEWYSTTTQTVSNPAIYITETLSGITVATQEFALSGYDTNAPFDPNSSVPANATSSLNTISATTSTSHAQDLLLGFEYGGGGMINPGTGFTGICLYASPCNFNGIGPDASEYEILTNILTDSLISMSQTGGLNWGFIVDSVQSASSTVASIAPSKGIIGTTIALRGYSFNRTTSVQFCGVYQPEFTVVNDSSITTVAPRIPYPSSAQTCDIVVTNNSGSSAISDTDRFSFLPNIVSINPTSATAGSSLTIAGSSFIGTTSVDFCGVSQQSFIVINDTQIRTTVPVTTIAASTTCNVFVTNAVGKSPLSSGGVFAYLSQTGSGGAAHNSSSPSSSNRTVYIIIASVGAITLIVMSQLIHPRNAEKKGQIGPLSQAVWRRPLRLHRGTEQNVTGCLGQTSY